MVPRTILTLPLPLSLTFKGNGASRPVSSSFSRMNAWCGRFALPLSLATRLIVRVSWALRATGIFKGDLGPKLIPIDEPLRRLGECSVWSPNIPRLRSLAALLAAGRDTAIIKAPRGGSLDSPSCQKEQGCNTRRTHLVWLVFLNTMGGGGRKG